MKLAALITFLLSTTLMASAEGTEGPDVSGVTDVVIIGDAGSTILTTNGSEPFRASLSQRRSEWVSRVSWLWSDDDCPNESTLRVEGTTLRVTVASGAGQSCHVIFEANLPEGGSVSFDQPAAEVDMKGTYGKISLKSSASDFRFAGTAQGLSAVCDALKVGISFSNVTNEEMVDLRSEFVEADIRFADAKAVSYRVDAGAAMVDSRFDNTPGAKPEIFIKADKAKVSIQ